ncbi:MAG TPA: roadblock/LC7 domain-containing protein [Gemmatimonadales bacterium]|nr:roadblock/LC7 domain-containing protein [Gemmatimonadales bacterium]
MSAPGADRPGSGAAAAPPARSGPGSSAADELARALDRISRVRGMRGSMWVSADDGLPVAQLLMEGVPGRAVAALAASLVRKVSGSAGAVGAGRVRFVQMEAAGGTLLVALAPPDLLVVALADGRVNVGLARLEMMRAAAAVAR